MVVRLPDESGACAKKFSSAPVIPEERWNHKTTYIHPANAEVPKWLSEGKALPYNCRGLTPGPCLMAVLPNDDKSIKVCNGS